MEGSIVPIGWIPVLALQDSASASVIVRQQLSASTTKQPPIKGLSLLFILLALRVYKYKETNKSRPKSVRTEFPTLESLSIHDFSYEDINLLWHVHSNITAHNLQNLKDISFAQYDGELYYGKDFLKWITHLHLTSITCRHKRKSDAWGSFLQPILSSQMASLRAINLSNFLCLEKFSDVISSLKLLEDIALHHFDIPSSVDTWKEICQSVSELPNLKIVDMAMVSYISPDVSCWIDGICTPYEEDKKAFKELGERMQGLRESYDLSEWKICDGNHVQYEIENLQSDTDDIDYISTSTSEEEEEEEDA